MSKHLRSQTRSRSHHQGNQGMPIADSHTALSTCRGAPVTLESAVSTESSAWRVHQKRELVPQQPEAHAWGGQGKHWGAWRPRGSTPRSPAHTSFLNHLSRARVHTQGQRDTADGDRRRARPSPGSQLLQDSQTEKKQP